MSQLCHIIGVSERTLQYVFGEQYSISPKTYLKNFRLNGVRRELFRSDFNIIRVNDVANVWVFWHMGQFAADYKKLFGELPSGTLRQHIRTCQTYDTIASSMLTYIPVFGVFLQELILGGIEVSEATLQIFHSFHTTLLPFAFLFCMSYHFWRIRKSGGVKIEKQSKQEMLPVIPELVTRELAFAAVVLCFLLLFSMFIDAPLTAMANPNLTPVSVKAPWYFLWLQELLLHIQPILALCVLPIAFVVFLLLLPFIDQTTERPSKSTKLILVSFVSMIVILAITGVWFRGAGMKLVLPW